MKNWWRRLSEQRVQWIIVSAFIAIWTLSGSLWLKNGWLNPWAIAGLLFLAFGVSLYLRRPWAKWLGTTAFIAALSAETILRLINKSFELGAVFFVLCVAGGLVGLWLMDDEEPRSDVEATPEQEKPFLSLVLLLREPRYLDATVLTSLASRAWDIELTVPQPSNAQNESADGEQEEEWFVVGELPMFLAKHPSAMCMIHDFDQPYFDDVDQAAKGCADLRSSKAIRDHQAWISVDVLQWHGDEDPAIGAYRLIARLLAELADDNVLAVVDPDASQIFPYDPELENKLKSDNPLAELRQGGYVPVISVPPDDPQLQAAVAEAKKRWPEFVNAFEMRSPGGENHFSVKAPFGGGDNVEFMWVKVTGIENDVIYGILGNEPANIPELNEGDRVKTTVSELNDWLYVVNDEGVGGFTIKVVMERAKRPRE